MKELQSFRRIVNIISVRFLLCKQGTFFLLTARSVSGLSICTDYQDETLSPHDF